MIRVTIEYIKSGQVDTSVTSAFGGGDTILSNRDTGLAIMSAIDMLHSGCPTTERQVIAAMIGEYNERHNANVKRTRKD
jgi:hypothetical protein